VRAVAVSPHLDDAIFSAGAALARLAAAGWEVQVVTVFTASVPEPRGFALACQVDKGLGPEVDYLALRRAEDREAVRRLGLGIPPVHLPFPEAPHRGYESAPALFAAPRADDAGIVGEVRTALGLLLAGADLVLAPVGLGGHVDHLQVLAALAPLADPVLWHDQPYALRLDGPPPSGWEDVAGEEARARKLDAAAAYTTQLAFQFPGQDGVPAGEPAMRRALGAVAERFDRPLPGGAAEAGAGAGLGPASAS
jgi:LmbE family N-acetylglucosaminyl deacetylase